MSTSPARFRRVLLGSVVLLLAASPLVLAGPPAPRDGGATVTLQEVLGASEGDLWTAYTTKKGIESLRGGRAEVDFRLGGTLRWHEDAGAETSASGWTVERVIAYVPTRMLALRRGEAPTWTVTTFESLGGDRTRVHVTRVGLGWGAEEEPGRRAAREEETRLLAGLKKRFPSPVATEDPVGARFSALRGTWESREGAPAGAADQVQSRLVVETGEGNRTGKRLFSVLRRYGRVGDALRLEGVHHFWREPDSGAWRGVSPGSSGLATWDVTWHAPSKAIHWGESGLGGRCQLSLEIAADDDAGRVRTSEAQGCIGFDRIWTRVP